MLVLSDRNLAEPRQPRCMMDMVISTTEIDRVLWQRTLGMTHVDRSNCRATQCGAFTIKCVSPMGNRALRPVAAPMEEWLSANLVQ